MEEHVETDKENDCDNAASSVNGRTRESDLKPNKFDLTSKLKEQIANLPDVLQYILLLKGYIEKQKKKIHKLKKKKHKPPNSKSIGLQTDYVADSKSIVEEVTEAAEQALQKTGFVYEETSGMYYDYNSGYYYNAEYGLYYDGNKGTYLRYNQDTQEYEFHSQVAEPVTTDSSSQKKSSKESKSRHKRKTKRQQESTHASKRVRRKSEVEDGALEEGECSDYSQTNSTLDEDSSSSDLDYANQWPPCMRIIVEESSISGVKQGSLHMLTYEGGTLGREGTHSILIPDINISKSHLNFSFNKESSQYQVTDVGSRNGTYLNGKRLAPSKVESEPTEVVHGSRVQVGGVVLLCHIHKGTQTCGHCEPGLIQVKKEEDEKVDVGSTSKTSDHKHQLKQLRKKFGITVGDQGKVVPGSGYTDRACVRRETVGTQNPHEKTKVASLHESIGSENKGFKLLSKMGWKEGQALGKDSQGILNPVELVSNDGMKGMGNKSDVPTVVLTKFDRQKQEILLKTQERYNQAPAVAEDIFEGL